MQESLTLAAATHVGLVRSNNEDSHAILQHGPGCPAALILADGMGGHRRGEVASQLAVAYLRERLDPILTSDQAPDPVWLQQQLSDIVGKANVRVYLGSLSDEDNTGMGTTLTAVIILPGQIVLAHVGDCRAYLFHAGRLVRLTDDHTLVHELLMAGSISQDEYRQHPKRNVLTRALGAPEFLQPDLVMHPLQTGDRLLLCSDGLHGLVDDGQIQSMLQQATGPEQLAQDLVDMALAAGGEDNITVLTAFA